VNYCVIRINQKNKNVVNEELMLRNHALSESMNIDNIFYDDSMQKDELGERKSFLSFLNTLQNGDKIIVTSIETLGWRVGELVQILAKIFDKNCEILCVQDGERLYPQMPANTLLAKLSLARSKNIEMGRSKLGRPQGSRSKSKYDVYLPQIVEFLKTSRNISALARQLGISRTSLKDYIASRKL
jgi:DNA invertase Pin-like site-specific DNA recombinase